MPCCLHRACHRLVFVALFVICTPLCLTAKTRTPPPFWGTRAISRSPILASLPSSSTNRMPTASTESTRRPADLPANHSEGPLPGFPTTSLGGMSHSCGGCNDLFKAERTHMASDSAPPRVVSEGLSSRLEYISSCQLPTDRGQFVLHAYRHTNKEGQQEEALAIVHGSVSGQTNVLVRVHDQCMTSEVLGSRRCDCRDQLEMALKRVAVEGGAVVYLPQEGRGIGLANKVAAYALQDQGFDTVDANLKLGFQHDERNYDYVPDILKDLGIVSIRLATNNPFKIDSLRSLGVNIEEVVPIEAPAHKDNVRYLQTKTNRMFHTLALAEVEDEIASEGTTDSDALSASCCDKDGAENFIEEVVTPAPTSAVERTEYCFGRDSVLAAIAAIKEGKMVVVVDDLDRENEGDLIMAADLVRSEDMAFIVRHSSGVVCVAMESDWLDHLELPQMVPNNQDPKRTAFTVTVDYKHGTSTGISAHDRALTFRKLADPTSQPTDFNRPGHVFPLMYRPGGVLNRRGHTEAAVDLARLAGRFPAGVLCEICNDDGSMARLPQLERFARQNGMVLTSIADLVAYRTETESQA